MPTWTIKAPIAAPFAKLNANFGRFIVRLLCDNLTNGLKVRKWATAVLPLLSWALRPVVKHMIGDTR